MMTRLLPMSSAPLPVIDSEERLTLLVPKGVPAVTLSARCRVPPAMETEVEVIERLPANVTVLLRMTVLVFGSKNGPVLVLSSFSAAPDIVSPVMVMLGAGAIGSWAGGGLVVARLLISSVPP